MSAKQHFILLLCIISIFLITSCSKVVYDVAYPTLNDGEYDTEFPYKNCSEQLETITKTLKKIRCTAFYQSYIFAESQNVTTEDLSSIDVSQTAIGEIHYNESAHGTATVVYSKNNRLALLTCAHVIDFPDTAVIHFSNAAGSPKPIQNMAVKLKQNYWAGDLPQEGQLKVLAVDYDRDIALLGKTISAALTIDVPVFNYPIGASSQLEWGSFVYIMGYPIGYQMITRGIVSNPNRDSEGSFLIDALFNRGFSGGIVLAIRDGVPNFELVGMTKSVSASHDYILVPEPDMNDTSFDPHIPYRGQTFVHKKTDINYGITYSISVETIVRFIEENKHQLARQGYDVNYFFKY